MADEQSQGLSDMSIEVDSMSPEDALGEYNRTMRNPRYTEPGPEAEDYWTHKGRVERMSKLYDRGMAGNPKAVNLAVERAKSSNPGMFDTLTKQGVTKEVLQADQDKYDQRQEQEAIEKAKNVLINYFGGEKEADAAIQSGKSLFKRFAKKEDIAFVEKTGLGNDPEFIQKLAEIDQILKRGGQKKR